MLNNQDSRMQRSECKDCKVLTLNHLELFIILHMQNQYAKIVGLLLNTVYTLP